MKKLLGLLLVALLLFSLTSCGSDPLKGRWAGTDELGNSNVVMEFDGAGNVTNFDNTLVQSTGTYKDNGDSTVTITLGIWEEPVTFVYDANDINSGILMLHDIDQIEPGYVLQLQK